jgi:hypothetical protein
MVASHCTTDTIDFVIVLSGRVWLTLEEGKHNLRCMTVWSSQEYCMAGRTEGMNHA